MDYDKFKIVAEVYPFTICVNKEIPKEYLVWNGVTSVTEHTTSKLPEALGYVAHSLTSIKEFEKSFGVAIFIKPATLVQ